MAASSNANLRLLQFVEAMIAAAEAYHSLKPITKRLVDEQFTGLGQYLRILSDGMAEGVCNALEDEKRRAGG